MGIVLIIDEENIFLIFFGGYYDWLKICNLYIVFIFDFNVFYRCLILLRGVIFCVDIGKIVIFLI